MVKGLHGLEATSVQESCCSGQGMDILYDTRCGQVDRGWTSCTTLARWRWKGLQGGQGLENLYDAHCGKFVVMVGVEASWCAMPQQLCK